MNMTTKSQIINIRVDPRLKQKVEAVFKKLGLSSGEAIRMFLTQVAIKNKIPFSLDLETDDRQENYIEVKSEDHLKELIGL